MSSVLEVSLPAVEPVDPVAELTPFCKQPATTGDAALIKTLGIAARRQLEEMLGLTLANRKFVQYEDGFPFFPYFQSPYAPLFGAAFPFYFGYGPIASYPYPAIGGLQNQMTSPFQKRLLRTPVTNVEKIIYTGTDGQPHGLKPGTDFVADFASQPGRLAPLPGQRWPVGIVGVNTVQIFYSAGYTSGASDAEDILFGPIPWQPLSQFPQFSYVVDDATGNVMLQTAAAVTIGAVTTVPTSDENMPAWPAIGATKNDGTCVWKNLGPVIGRWTATHVYTAPAVVIDSNDNLQYAAANLTSAGSEPTWSATRGTTTADNGGSWLNLGANWTTDGVANPPDAPVEYKGDTGIPEQLKVAIMILAAHWYSNREPVTPGTAGTVPFSVEAIIQTNRVLDFGPVP